MGDVTEGRFESSQPTPFDPPANPRGGRTLIVDAADAQAYATPSAALLDARDDDQVFIRRGVYEDKIVISKRPLWLIGAGRDHVTVLCRRSGPVYLQQVPRGHISGITFRYVGSDQHAAMNILDSVVTITQCRAIDGLLSGVVVYGPQCRPILSDNEVRRNRESGIFVFAGAQPRLAHNMCVDNHHFGIAVRDAGSHPELIRNICRDNMMSGILLFHHAEALLLENTCQDNCHWGMVITPDCTVVPDIGELPLSNVLTPNPRGAIQVTDQPLAEIGR